MNGSEEVINAEANPSSAANVRNSSESSKGNVGKVSDVESDGNRWDIDGVTKMAINAAKAKYIPNGKSKILRYVNYGVIFNYLVTNNAIDICLSPEHQGKSANKGVHLALAEHLDEVINNSVEAEEHPDYIKNNNGKRDGNKINPDTLMHRFYGAVRIDGKCYRVMTLMREDRRTEKNNGIHTYEVQKIEVLNDESPSTPNGVETPQSNIDGLPLAKLLKGVEKAYEKGKKILSESENLTSEEESDEAWDNGEFDSYHYYVESLKIDGEDYTANWCQEW